MESRADKMMRYANMSVIPKAYIADIVTELETKDIPHKKEIITLLSQIWVIRAM